MRFGVWRSQCRQQAGRLWKVEAQCAGLRVPGQGLSPEYAPALPAHSSPWGFLPLPPFWGPSLASPKESALERRHCVLGHSLRPAQASVHHGLRPPATCWETGRCQVRCPAPGLVLEGVPSPPPPPTPQQLLPYTVGKQVSSCPWGGTGACHLCFLNVWDPGRMCLSVPLPEGGTLASGTGRAGLLVATAPLTCSV